MSLITTKGQELTVTGLLCMILLVYMKFYSKSRSGGFTLIEVLFVVGIISIMATIVLFSTTEARKQSRDKAQQASLEQMQLSLRLYHEAYDRYPVVAAEGACFDGTQEGSLGTQKNNSSIGHATVNCALEYIDVDGPDSTVAPIFVTEVPNHTNSDAPDCEYIYMADNIGSAYKLIAENCVEADTVDEGDKLARCSSAATQEADGDADEECSDTHPNFGTSYAIYSSGAEDW
jgi:prepilin-type N-terminal cleavage/methylation domain-containing protein